MNSNDDFAPHIDQRFGVKSYEQYLRDLKEKKFTKICMTQVLTADMTIATYGEELYFERSRQILAMGNEAYKMMGIDHLVHVYIHSYKSFMAVANDDMSDEDFLGLMKANHEQYELIQTANNEIGGISRFAVAFGDDLVNKAQSAFYYNRDEQNNFIIASNERDLLQAARGEDMAMFEVINRAIMEDEVVPFFQGIRNNHIGEIVKYEALMRIYDKDGKILSPYVFLEVSKKLKLYLPLSKMMIDKALKLFEGKKSDLGINISMYDVASEDFRAWFLKRISEHPDPSKVTIEFVETENYNENDVLIAFLKDAREIGCKIAVDDFGVGFATYTSIISLKPDIIKIDGGIIKRIDSSEENRMVLDSICYMAKLIGAKTVAEFVENESIQRVVEQNGIDFSQGYLYSKPTLAEDKEIV